MLWESDESGRSEEMAWKLEAAFWLKNHRPTRIQPLHVKTKGPFIFVVLKR